MRIVNGLAKSAIGPWSQGLVSQAVVASGFVFTSGTVGIDPISGVAADQFGEQFRQALKNLTVILEDAGSSVDCIVRTTVWYTDINDFELMNSIYKEFINHPPPVRSSPGNILFPGNLKVSIDAIAVLVDPAKECDS